MTGSLYTYTGKGHIGCRVVNGTCDGASGGNLYNFFLDFYAMRNPAEFEPIRETTANVLRFVSVYLLADALNVIFASALRGAGDANFIMKGTLAVFVPIVVAAFVGVFGFGRGVYWCWSLMTLYVFSAGTLFAVRFYRGAWRNASLVEVDLLGDADSPEASPSQDLTSAAN